MTVRLGVLEGDGIGPEIVPAARRAVAATDLDVAFEELPVGWDGYEAHGSTVPGRTVERLRDCDGWLLGPVLVGEYPDDDPAGGNPSGTLRTEFDLYANVRPARTYGDLGPDGMDLTVFRQNTEGFYADRNMHAGDGQFMPTRDVACSVRVVTRGESRRIAEAAFEHAAAAGADVTAVHKANVLDRGDGLFLEACRAVADRHPNVGLETAIVDAFAADLVAEPTAHEVVVTTNMFGDIISDEAAAIAGGLGLAPGLNRGTDRAMAQATHGAAPDVAGEGVANPVGMVLSAALLLSWLGGEGVDGAAGAADAVEAAVARTIESGVCTPDVGGDASTSTVADAVVERIRDGAGGQ